MYYAALAEFAVCWVVWWYPFLFRAPHRQNRPSITLRGRTFAGLFLETIAFFLAFSFSLSISTPPAWPRIVAAMLLCPIAPVMGWTAIKHLGRQFRINAGLYEDHELVHTGPYAVVRHPIYSSLLTMLLATILLFTRWPWSLVSVALFIAGTEIRVHIEDGLLASRFGARFEEYKSSVPAYIPYLR